MYLGLISIIKKNLWAFEFLAVALISYSLAQTAVNVVTVKLTAPAPVTGKAKPAPTSEERSEKLTEADFAVIASRNIFDSENKKEGEVEEKPDPEEETPAASRTPSGDPVQTSLDLELLSTFAVGEGKDKRSSATLRGKDIENKDGDVFRVGESFSSGTEITQVLHDRVIFSNRNRLEYVLLNDLLADAKGKSPEKKSKETPAREKKETAKTEEPAEEGGTFTVKKSDIENALANLDELFGQIRAVPYVKDGKTSGLKLLSVKGDSIFSKLGLKRGDVLQKVNGKEFDIQQGLSLFNSLKDETHISLELLRRGKAQTLEYDVK